MTIKQFRKIQKILKIALNQAEKEAIEDGVDITSQEYDKAISVLRRRILEELGLTPEKYEELRLSFKPPKKPISYKELKDIPPMPETLSPKEIKGLIAESISESISKIISKSISEIPKPTTTIINKIVKEVVKEKPQIIKTKEIVKKVVKEADRTEIDKLWRDFGLLQKSFKNLKIKDWTKDIADLNWRIENINTRRASIANRSDAGSFNTAIADSRYYKKEEVDALISVENLWDRSGTTLEPHTANDSVDLGSGGLTTTGGLTAGASKLGDGGTTNYCSFASDRTLTLHGSARVKRHWLIDPSRFKLPATNYPSEGFEGIFATLDFDKNTEESAYVTDVIPCRWDNTTDIEVVVGWLHDTADNGAVVWGIEYLGIETGETIAGSTTTITQTSAGNHPENVLIRTTFTNKMLAENIDHGNAVGIRLFRQAGNLADTLDEDARVIEVHFHFTMNKLGG